MIAITAKNSDERESQPSRRSHSQLPSYADGLGQGGAPAQRPCDAAKKLRTKA